VVTALAVVLAPAVVHMARIIVVIILVIIPVRSFFFFFFSFSEVLVMYQ